MSKLLNISSNSIHERLKQERKNQGLNQQELGEKAGVSRHTIANVEKGKLPNTESLQRIFKALDVTPNSIFGYKEVQVIAPEAAEFLGDYNYLDAKGKEVVRIFVRALADDLARKNRINYNVGM